MEFRFDSPTAADTLVVIQHYVARRIGELRVEVRENAQWVTIATQEVPDGDKRSDLRSPPSWVIDIE